MPAQPKKIAVVSRDFGDVGGAELFAARLAEGVAEDLRFEVHVFTSREYRGHPAIRVHQLPQPWGPRFLQKPLFCWMVRRALAKLPPFDLIHTHELLPGAHIVTYGTPHQFWVREVRKKNWFGLNDRLIQRLERLMLGHSECHTILPMSSMVEQSLAKVYPALQGKFRVLPPGIDSESLPVLSLDTTQKAEARSQLGIPREGPLALFVGNNYQHKGLDALLHAMAEGGDAGGAADLRLWVIGRGPVHRYRALSHKLGLGNRVNFLGLLRSGISTWFLAADFLVLYSAYETYGMVALEAHAHGLPVLISDRVGAKDLIDSSETGGRIIPLNGPRDQLTAALDAFSLPRDRAQALALASQTRAKRSWREAQQALIRIYESCLFARGQETAPPEPVSATTEAAPVP